MTSLLRSPGPGLLAAIALALAAPIAAAPPAEERPVCDAPGNQGSPAAAPDGRGGAFVAWCDSRRGQLDVYALHLLASGAADPTWPAGGLVLCDAPGDQAAPALVPDGKGGAIVAWFDQRGGKDHDVYVQRVSSRGRAQWLANGVALCTADDHQHAVALVGDGSGGAIATWFDHRNGEADIYAQRVTAAGTVDRRWPFDGVPVCSAPGGQYFPRPVSDGKGGAIIAWYDRRAGHYDIYAQHVLASGRPDPRWPADGRALCTAPRDQRRPIAVTDQRGGAIVVWEDLRGTAERDLIAQRVLASGTLDPDWPEGGLAVCREPADQRDAAMVADGAGGAIVVWQDARRDESDVYAHHLTGAGVMDPAWPRGGRALCEHERDQSAPAIAGDGAGGAIVVWQDLRGGEHYDLYAARVSARGELDLTEPAGGRELCAAPGHQTKPVVVEAGRGAVIVAWEDGRHSTHTDLFARRWRVALAEGTRRPRSASP